MNIVFVFADDWGRYASAYAEHETKSSVNQLIYTPNFDRIAREGALFTNALVPAPSCTPCRSSVLTGRYFWETGLGAILNGAVWDGKMPSYPLYLEKEGYHIGFTYKAWSPGTEPDAPYGGARNRYTNSDKPLGDFAHFSQNVLKQAECMSIESAKEKLLDEVRSSINMFFEKRKENQSFCYWLGPTNTHRIWEKGSGKKIWGLDPDEFKGRLPEFLPDVHEIREDFCDYLGEAQAVDAALGVLIDKLEALGEMDNTLIVVSGDHGIPGIPRAKCNLYDIGSEVALAMRCPDVIKPGLVFNNMVNIMDLAPTFIDFASKEIPEWMSGRSLKRLLVEGEDKERKEYVVTGRERHVWDARPDALPYPQRAIRTKDYLYILNFEPERWPMGTPKGTNHNGEGLPSYEQLEFDTRVAYADMDASPTKAWMIYNQEEEEVAPLFNLAFNKRPREELFDLRKDKYYINNVANNLEYSEIKQQLEKMLMKELITYNDPRVVESDCRYEKAPYAGEPKIK